MYIRIALVFLMLTLFSTIVRAGVKPEVKEDFSIACDLAGRSDIERREAIQSIVRLGVENEDYFISLLASDRTIERQIAAQILGDIGGKKSEPVLIAALDNKDVFLQGAAARALAVLYSRLNQSVLLTSLQNNEKQLVRLAVMYGAYKRARYKKEKLDPALIGCVSDLLVSAGDNVIIEAAVTLLRYANTQEAVAALLTAAKRSSNPAIQIKICQALAAIAPEGKAPQIEELAMSGRPRVAVEAWNALRAMGYADTDKALSGLVVNSDPWVQAQALKYLAQFGPQYNPLFISALKSAEPAVRFEALKAIEKNLAVNAAGEVAKLMGPLGDSNPAVRAQAALVFAALTHSGGLTPLLKDSRNENEKMLEFRLEAIRALGELGDKAALRALLDFLRDDDVQVRTTAVRSLVRLGDKRALSQLKEMVKLRKGEELYLLQEAIAQLEKD